MNCASMSCQRSVLMCEGSNQKRGLAMMMNCSRGPPPFAAAANNPRGFLTLTPQTQTARSPADGRHPSHRNTHLDLALRWGYLCQMFFCVLSDRGGEANPGTPAWLGAGTLNARNTAPNTPYKKYTKPAARPPEYTNKSSPNNGELGNKPAHAVPLESACQRPVVHETY